MFVEGPAPQQTRYVSIVTAARRSMYMVSEKVGTTYLAIIMNMLVSAGTMTGAADPRIEIFVARVLQPQGARHFAAYVEAHGCTGEYTVANPTSGEPISGGYPPLTLIHLRAGALVLRY